MYNNNKFNKILKVVNNNESLAKLLYIRFWKLKTGIKTENLPPTAWTVEIAKCPASKPARAYLGAKETYVLNRYTIIGFLMLFPPSFQQEIQISKMHLVFPL